jgi:hypothetical protein
VPNVRGVLSPVPWPVRGDHILSSLQKGSPGVGRPGCMAWAIPAATLCTVLNGIREGRTDNSGHRITKKENVRPSTHRLLHDGARPRPEATGKPPPAFVYRLGWNGWVDATAVEHDRAGVGRKHTPLRRKLCLACRPSLHLLPSSAARD